MTLTEQVPGSGRRTERTRPARSRWGAAGLGLLCGTLALAVADLVAGLLAPSASPVLAVGSAFIDRTPGWLKDAAIAWFGLHDKQVLLGGLGVVLSVLSALAGLLAARSVRLLVPAAAVLAAVAAAAALSRPGARFWWALPALIGVSIGAAGLVRLTRGWRARSNDLRGGDALDPAAGAATDQVPDRSRRGLLTGAGTVAGLAALSAAGGRALAARSGTGPSGIRLPLAATPAPAPVADLALPGLTPLVTANRDFYRIDTALSVPRVDADSWRLRVHGLVESEVELDLRELLDEQLVERWLTLTCVSNEVGGRLAGNARWLGYPLARLLERARPSAEADMVLSTSADGWTCSTPLAALTDGRDALLAVGMNGAPLPAEHGFPARLVVPGLYGYVSATKWVVDLEVTRFDRAQAYWTSRGYAAQAPVRTFSRIDVPKPFARVAAGRVAVAGTTWAQQRGIDAIQVRVDGGRWNEARLAAAISSDTWRQWSWQWDATPGQHTLEVAATDGAGAMQPGTRRTPRPDGATGWHSVVVQVT